MQSREKERSLSENFRLGHGAWWDWDSGNRETKKASWRQSLELEGEGDGATEGRLTGLLNWRSWDWLGEVTGSGHLRDGVKWRSEWLGGEWDWLGKKTGRRNWRSRGKEIKDLALTRSWRVRSSRSGKHYNQEPNGGRKASYWYIFCHMTPASFSTWDVQCSHN